MSVIFNALQKLKAQSVNGKERKKALLQKKHESRSFQKMLFSPFILLVFVLIGLGAFYGIDHLKEYIKKNRASFKTTKIKTGSKKPDYQSPSPSKSNQNPASHESQKAQSQYINKPSNNIDSQQNKTHFLPQRELMTKGDIAGKTHEEQMEISPDTNQGITQNQASFQNGSPHFKPAGLIGQFSDTNFKGNETGLPSEILSASDLSKKTLLESSVENIESPISKQERINQAEIKKSSKIARIVTKIEESILQNNYDQTEILISKLTKLKNKDNNYVLKLKAFLLVKKNDYKSAAPLLEKVLTKNKNDLEAGINMAIIEAKTNQKQAARIRLSKLAKAYPDNTLVPEILGKLE